jgi:hypothetical protein
MIYPVMNPNFVDNLIPLMQKIEGLPSIPKYLEYIKMAIPQEAALLLVDIGEGDKINSFAFAESMDCIIDRECFINLAYYDPKDHKIGKEIEKIVSRWALIRNCTKIALITDEKRVKAYTKKYGFTDKFIYLRKSINQEELTCKETNLK